MAVRTVKARVELDGEKEYKQALSELNSGNKTLASEMKKLQSEYKGNSESVEFLTKKGEILERQLLQQRDKVETLRQAVQKSAEQYGESDKRTQGWIQQLNYAEAAEFDLQHAIDENNAALKGENETMLSLGDTVQKFADKLGIKVPDGAKKALDGMKGMSSGTVLAMSAAAGAVVAVVEALKKLHQMTVDVAAKMDELNTKSMVSGLSTELLQELEYAAPLIDVEVDTITGSLTKLTKNMASAADGNESMRQSFEDLGIGIQNADGSLRSAQDVFFEIVDALGQMGNDTERDAAAMEILGKSAQELNPLIKQGTSTLQEYMNAAKQNYVLTEDQIKALTDLDDQVQSNRLQWEALEKQLASQFAPAATEVLQNFSDLVSAAGEALVNSGIIKGVGEILKALSDMIKPLTELLGIADGTADRLRPIYEVLHGIAGALAWIQDIGSAAIGALTYVTPAGREKWNTALGYNAQYGQYSHLQQWNGTAAVMDAQLSGYREYGGMDMSNTDLYGYDSTTGLYYDKYSGNYIYGNATGNDNWKGGLTWVGEAGPELVALPGGSQILNAQDSRNVGGVTIGTIVIDAKSVKEFNDIIEIVRSQEIYARMG